VKVPKTSLHLLASEIFDTIELYDETFQVVSFFVIAALAARLQTHLSI
jgi:hypothetical protein